VYHVCTRKNGLEQSGDALLADLRPLGVVLPNHRADAENISDVLLAAAAGENFGCQGMSRPGLCRIGVRRRCLEPVERAFCEIQAEYPRGIVRSPAETHKRFPASWPRVGGEVARSCQGAETAARRQRTTLFWTTGTPLRKPNHPQISGLE
jgi:hypothetical protein